MCCTAADQGLFNSNQETALKIIQSPPSQLLQNNLGFHIRFFLLHPHKVLLQTLFNLNLTEVDPMGAQLIISTGLAKLN